MTVPELARTRGVLLDVDGVLTVSWEPVAGAAEVVRWLREHGWPFLLMTNTTTHSRRELAETLRGVGFDVAADDVVNAPTATAAYLRKHHPDAPCFLLGDVGTSEDLEGITFVERAEDAEVVVVAGADHTFTWDRLNVVLRLLVAGAPLVAMHRNLTWMTADGLKLDSGAYVTGLEAAAEVTAAVAGKPAPAFFEQALERLGLTSAEVAMVGDDLDADVLAAQAVGATGILVRTGKYRPDAEASAGVRPDVVIGSVAELPAVLGGGM